MDKFLLKIYKISYYIKHNYYEIVILLKNIVDTNNNISSILILNKHGIIEDFYANYKSKIYIKVLIIQDKSILKELKK